MYSPIDTQSHAGSSSSLHWQAATMNHVSHNHMTLTFWLRCIKYINNQYICTKFGAHSSSCFLFRVWKHRWTQTHRVNWSSYPATTGVGNKHSTILCSPTGQPTSSVEGASQNSLISATENNPPASSFPDQPTIPKGHANSPKSLPSALNNQ